VRLTEDGLIDKVVAAVEGMSVTTADFVIEEFAVEVAVTTTVCVAVIEAGAV